MERDDRPSRIDIGARRLRAWRQPWAAPGALVAVGLLLRLYHLDAQSLWSDEALSLTAARLPLDQLLERIAKSWNHPPLHYLLLHGWFRWFGFGVWQARSLSVLFGTLSIAMLYAVARHLFDRRTALASTALLAISQLGVMYAQEARSYAQLSFFVLCAVLLFLVAVRERRTAAWWGFVLAATAMIYTHYYGTMVVAALFVWALLSSNRRALRIAWLAPAAVVVALPGLWWWTRIGLVGRVLDSSVGEAQPYWFAVHWWTPLANINDFNNGRFAGLHAPPPLWTFIVGGLLFSVPGLLALRPLLSVPPAGTAAALARERTLLLFLLLALPLGLAWTLGLLNVQYDLRYVLFCIFPYYLLVAQGLTELRPSTARRVWMVLALIYGLGALRANYFVPYKENYRDAFAYLAEGHRAGDCSVFLPFGRIPLEWAIYRGDDPPLRVTPLASVASGQAQCDRVWLITYQRVEAAIEQGREGQRMLEHTHRLVDQRQFFWVHVGLYVARERVAFDTAVIRRNRMGGGPVDHLAVPAVVAAPVLVEDSGPAVELGQERDPDKHGV